MDISLVAATAALAVAGYAAGHSYVLKKRIDEHEAVSGRRAITSFSERRLYQQAIASAPEINRHRPDLWHAFLPEGFTGHLMDGVNPAPGKRVQVITASQVACATKIGKTEKSENLDWSFDGVGADIVGYKVVGDA